MDKLKASASLKQAGAFLFDFLSGVQKRSNELAAAFRVDKTESILSLLRK